MSFTYPLQEMGQTSVLELWLLDWIYSPSESIHLAQAETESKNNPINNSIIKTHIYKTTVVHVHVFIFSLKRFKLLKILMIYLIKLNLIANTWTFKSIFLLTLMICVHQVQGHTYCYGNSCGHSSSVSKEEATHWSGLVKQRGTLCLN